MTRLEKEIALALRRTFRIGFGVQDKFETNSENVEYSGQQASDIIRDGLLADKPFAVSRFGHSELRALLTYMHIRENGSNFRKIMDYARGEKVEPWWFDHTVEHVTHNAGVFPADISVVERFCQLLLKEIPHIDVLGSWLGGEVWVKHLMPDTKFIMFHDFYHFLHESPWTSALKGKKVLVVHPFASSIEVQFKKKELIFPGKKSLPDFELLTMKAVQSIAGNRPGQFKDWFDALDFMKQGIARRDFDIAILGCGAYGMPLATFVKTELKKKSVHLGGNVQILFGIKGSRWENDPQFHHIFNEHWIKPLPEETPKGHLTIDNNCYW